MEKSRRRFLKHGTTAGVLGVLPHRFSLASQRSSELAARIDSALTEPVLRSELFKQPVKIASIDLLENNRKYVVRVRASDGATGLAGAHNSVIRSTYPILLNRVAPFFIGKDARELEALITGVYLADSNYKWQGLPFWVPIACLEIAILDLLGKVAAKSIGELLGGVVRREIPVYRASGTRGNTPEQEIEHLRQLVAETGAKAIKFRLGGRMHFNAETTRRDVSLIALTRKVFGDEMTIYADANGSYDIPTAIKTGRLMEEYKLSFFEEPCPFDYYDETKQIADALAIPIAGGEQESSLRRFRWIIEHEALQIVQPDILYFGGFVRSIRVARMAAAAGLSCTPHMSGEGLGFLYVAHFASCVRNSGLFQEFKGEEEDLPVSSDTSSLKSEMGVLKVPTGPGLGVTIDPAFINKATRVSA
jgi:L-alanine-DL-glutamate epimerase-like enolase superfamily enzyme